MSYLYSSIIFNMYWVLFLFFVSCQALQETVMFCIPSQLESIEKQTLEKNIKKCLETNFIYGVDNLPSKEQFLESYLNTFRQKQITEQLEDTSQHQKEQLMLILRDIQKKSSNNVHAIKKCASLSEKMPISISIALEVSDIFSKYKLWKHHTKKDFDYCSFVLHDRVIPFQLKKINQLNLEYQSYNEGFQQILSARNQTKTMQQHLFDIRQIFIQDIIEYQIQT